MVVFEINVALIIPSVYRVNYEKGDSMIGVNGGNRFHFSTIL